MTILYYFSIALFLLLCFCLSSLILMQESKSGGMGSSFGGEATQALLGTSAPDILKRATAWMIVFFLSACILLNFWTESLSIPAYLQAPSVPEVEMPIEAPMPIDFSSQK